MGGLVLACPHCSQPIASNPGMEGQTIRCPHCRRLFQLPEAAAIPSSLPDPMAIPPAISEPPTADPYGVDGLTVPTSGSAGKAASTARDLENEEAEELVDVQEVKACPFCGEQVLTVAKKCKHCGEVIDVTLRCAEEAKRASRAARSGRTESKAFQVHPDDERVMTKTMETFGWNLLNSQDVKTVDNQLERRGDTIYNVRTTESYVKLSFSRDVDLPNIEKLRELEQRYHSLSIPPRPSVNWALWGCLGVLSCGIGWVVGVILSIVNTGPVREWEAEVARITLERRQILAEARQY